MHWLELQCPVAEVVTGAKIKYNQRGCLMIQADIRLTKVKSIKIRRLVNTKNANWSKFNVKLGPVEERGKFKENRMGKSNRKEELDFFVAKYTDIIVGHVRVFCQKRKSNKQPTSLWWLGEFAMLK